MTYAAIATTTATDAAGLLLQQLRAIR